MASVRGFDSFGVPVQLNFNKQATHNTALGGCCSIIAATLMIMFISLELLGLFLTNSYNTQSSSDFITNRENNAPIYTLNPD